MFSVKSVKLALNKWNKRVEEKTYKKIIEVIVFNLQSDVCGSKDYEVSYEDFCDKIYWEDAFFPVRWGDPYKVKVNDKYLAKIMRDSLAFMYDEKIKENDVFLVFAR